MKPLKIIAGIFAVLLLLAGGVAGYLVATFDAARLKQEVAAAVERQTGRVLNIEGELALGFWPDVAVTLGRARLSERGGAGEFARLERARVAVALWPLLSRQMVVKHVELDGLAVTVIRDKDGALNVADLLGGQPQAAPNVGAGGTAPQVDTGGTTPIVGAGGTTPAVPLAIDIAGIRITNARLDWRDEQAGSRLSLTDLDFTSGAVRMADGRLDVAALALAARGTRDADAFTLQLEAPGLAIAPEGARSETLKLSATLDGKGRKLVATLALAGVAGNAKTLKADRLALDTDVKLADLQLVAQLASPVAFDLDKQDVALGQLDGKLTLTHPKLPQKMLALTLSGTASADLARQSAAAQLAVQLDDSKIKARVDIGKFAPLALVFDLAIDQLDLDKYLPPPDAADKKPEAKIDLAALQGLNLRGTVQIGRFTAAGLKASDVRLKLDARDGRLNVAPLSANLYEGKLDGTLSVDAAGNRYAAKQQLSNVQVAPLLGDLLDKDMLAGRGDVMLDVASHGDSVGALKQALAGNARIRLADGAIKGINIGQKLRDVKSLLGGGKDVAVAGDAGQKTDFTELTASFRIANGVARNDDLMAKSPLLRLAGAGDIDIGNSRLDYLLKTSIVATSTGQGGKDLDHVKGLTIPVRLTGPFDKPDWKLELAGLAGAAAKAQVTEKAAEIRQQAEDKLKGRLKGLFN